MNPSFIVYLDESGDEGFSFERGSSNWFILSAIIMRKEKDIETVKLIDRVRILLKKPDKKPLHFRDLKHEQKIPFLDEIAKADLRAISVLVDKPLIKEPEKFQERYRLYFYSVRFVLERVSWYCRDQKRPQGPGDGSAKIIFSNRSGMSYPEMKDYFHHLKERTDALEVRIDWSSIRPDQIMAYSPGQRMGLQVADAVAGSFFYAVEKSQYGFTEDRYVRILKPVIYNRRGIYKGYGIKFWPLEDEEFLKKNLNLNWLDYYSGPGTQDPTL